MSRSYCQLHESSGVQACLTGELSGTDCLLSPQAVELCGVKGRIRLWRRPSCGWGWMPLCSTCLLLRYLGPPRNIFCCVKVLDTFFPCSFVGSAELQSCSCIVPSAWPAHAHHRSPACLPTGAQRQQKFHHNPIQHRRPISSSTRTAPTVPLLKEDDPLGTNGRVPRPTPRAEPPPSPSLRSSGLDLANAGATETEIVHCLETAQ